MDYTNAFGAEFREVQERNHDGKDVRVVVASRVYATDPDDLWNALTDAERIPRWFLPISGRLELGGRYQLEANAGGSILRCDPPEALEVTWEFGEQTSWVRLRLAQAEGGTRLTLEHLTPKDEGAEEHWKQYGPGAAGVGWDLSFLGLALHLGSGGEAVDPQESHAWMVSEQGRAFMRDSANRWGEAHVRAGEDREVAEATAQRTGAFYTGG
jgi:uncharacterized protein YndB with AHSA1/START domain